jgi:hypothetical protein
MDRPDKDCKDVIKKTGGDLKCETLKLLSLSLQRKLVKKRYMDVVVYTPLIDNVLCWD